MTPQYEKFLAMCESKGWTIRTIDHIDHRNRKIIIYRGEGKQPVIAMVTLMGADGYAIYFASYSSKIEDDIRYIEEN